MPGNIGDNSLGNNTLAKKFGVDVFAAALAAFIVSPFITIIDRSIIENASGRATLSTSLKKGFHSLFSRPFAFIRTPSFLLVFGVYSATYSTANTIDTICSFASRDSQTPKFIGTTLVNLSTCIYKDRAFTRMFGMVAPKGLPLGTYGLFAARDSLTIAASFNLPDGVSARLRDSQFLRDHGVPISYETSQNVAQILCPAIMQIFSCTFHLLGLDLYNRPKMSLNERIEFLKRIYVKTAITRIARIGPAFGIGGVANRMIRERGNSMIIGTGERLMAKRGATVTAVAVSKGPGTGVHSIAKALSGNR
ncbi:3769_t:CDS:2 [Acaulospora morrowiae]|uniref:3769_t:CDS:1 n=1 Tax=Acaulospora morrowiae TaxID=94023 RepID=A0A9N9CV63_9GLOM|nr:3769_t:CDS:2 [Acaulospora morrowiae]